MQWRPVSVSMSVATRTDDQSLGEIWEGFTNEADEIRLLMEYTFRVPTI